MKRVTGIGGIFFKSENPDKLYQWYDTTSESSERRMGKARCSNGVMRKIPRG
jgi:hypothetical protein